jgi:hypothetical protein
MWMIVVVGGVESVRVERVRVERVRVERWGMRGLEAEIFGVYRMY